LLREEAFNSDETHPYDFSVELGETGYEGEFQVVSFEFFEDARLWTDPGR